MWSNGLNACYSEAEAVFQIHFFNEFTCACMEYKLEVSNYKTKMEY